MRRNFFGKKAWLALSAASLSVFAAGCASTGAGKNAASSLAPVARAASGASEGVYYSLFVRSFADSDGDGIGDFNGITAKLDYLNDGDDSTTSDLGITGIWLLPIFPSQSYHGYDVDDYFDVNPQYGTMADFENMLRECKKRGISVIIDMTFNHSSTYTEWFKDSKNPDDPHRSYYRWITADDKRYNINQDMWGHRVWNEDKSHPGNYYAGLFGNHMPDFNLDSPELRDEFKRVVKFWLDKGVSGFRFDAAGHVYNSAKSPAGANSTGKAVAWWKEIVDYAHSVNPGAYCVGEVWEPNSIRAQYIAGLGSDFHFDMGNRIVDTLKDGDDGNNAYANGLEGDYKRLAQSNPDYIDAPFLSNHDQARAAGLLRGNAEMCKAAASMYMLAEGIPFVYYGEEIGMRSGTDDPSKRTPMLWNKTWEDNGKPVDKKQTTWASSRYNAKTLPVSVQTRDPDSLLQFYKRIIRLKTAHPALFAGRFSAVAVGTPNISSWQMKSDAETALVMVNVTSSPLDVEIPEAYSGFDVAFASDEKSGAPSVSADGKTRFSIPAYGTLVLSKAE